MFKNWYKLTGVSNELFGQWKENLRNDILWWIDESGDVEMRIQLPIWAAAKMKRQIEEFNAVHEYCLLGLEKIA